MRPDTSACASDRGIEGLARVAGTIEPLGRVHMAELRKNRFGGGEVALKLGQDRRGTDENEVTKR